MIATVTFNPAVDQTVELSEDLEPGTVMRTDRQRFDAGGKGINVAKYLEALGTDALATGPVGGFTGDFIAEALAEDGIPAEFVGVDGTTRLNSTVVAAGEEYKINHSGPELDAAVVDEIRSLLEEHGPDAVVVSGSLPPGLDAGAVDRVAAGPWDAVVDLSGGMLSRLEEEEYALCKPNQKELAEATGMPTGTAAEVAAAARALRDEGFDAVLASMGGDGAVYVDAEVALFAEAFDVEVADTVGAGDAVVAGFLSARESGADPADALRRGIALSARVVSVHGTQVPPLDGLEAMAGEVVMSGLD